MSTDHLSEQAYNALRKHQHNTRGVHPDEDPEQALSDMLASLRHYAIRYDVDFEAALEASYNQLQEDEQ